MTEQPEKYNPKIYKAIKHSSEKHVREMYAPQTPLVYREKNWGFQGNT